MMKEVEKIFEGYVIKKTKSDDGVSPIWTVKLNTDVDLHILFESDREVPYISFFDVEADLLWERHSRTWLEFEHCETFDYLLERLRETPGAYGLNTLGKSYSKYCMEQVK